MMRAQRGRHVHRSLTSAVALATVAGIAVPFAVGHAASGGGASAQAVFTRSTTSPTGTDAQSSTPFVEAPADPGTHSTSTDLGAGDDTSAAAVTTSAVSATATNSADAYSAHSRVDGLLVTVQGVPLMTAGELSVTTTCAFGKPGVATIDTNEVTVSGDTVPASDVPSYSRQIPLPDGGSVTVSLTQLSSAGAQGAAAQALRMHYAVTDSGNSAVSDGDVVLAAASCQAPTAPASPAATVMTPTHGPTAGGTTVTIAGSGLGDATSVGICDVAVTDITVNDDGTALTFVTPPCEAGPRAVSVTASSTTVTVPESFTYEAPDATAVPTAADRATLAAIVPRQGSTAGGTPVTLSGTNLDAAASVTICGATITALEIAADGSSVMFASPPCDPGPVPVSVRFDDGSALAAPHDFTYVAPANGAQTAADTASITGLSPASGPTAGGTTLTISGSRLDAATGVTICGTAASDVSVSADGTRIVATTPACPAGPRIPVVRFGDGSTRASARTFLYVGPVAFGEASGAGTLAGSPPRGSRHLAGSDMLPHTGASAARLAVPGLIAIAAGLALAARRRYAA